MARGYPDYEGGKSGLYLKPEWAAFEAIDMTFEGATPVPVSWGVSLTVSYTVPSGKTLYITDVSWWGKADAAADGDNNQIASLWILDVLDPTQTNWFRSAGNGGGAASFSKPIVIPAGHRLDFVVKNEANHVCNIAVAGCGYEL